MEIGDKVITMWRGGMETGIIIGRKGKTDFYFVRLWTGECCWRYSADMYKS